MKRNILIIEDSQNQAIYISNILQHAGHSTSIANNAEAGIKKAKSELVDLILLDLVLPDKDGFETCSELHSFSETCEIPVIFLTSQNDENSIIKGLKCGAVDFIIKPFNKEELLLRISNQLSIREKDQQNTAIFEEFKSITDNLNATTEKLRYREEQYRTLINAIPDGIIVLDLNKNIKFASQKAHSIFKITDDDELIGKPFSDFIVDRDKNNFEALFNSALLKTNKKNGHFEMYRVTGEVFIGEISTSVLINSLDLPDGILLVIVDITEQSKVEKQVLIFSTAIMQSPTSIIITDLEGKIEFINPKFTEITGYSFDEVKGKNARILKSGHTAKHTYSELWNTILSGSVWQGEFLNVKKDKTQYWEYAVIAPVKDELGKVIKLLAVKIDNTRRKKAEFALEASEKQLLEANNLKDKILMTVNEALKNPMTTIAQVAEFLSKNYEQLDSDKKKNYLNSIYTTTINALQILENVLPEKNA